MSSPNGHPVIGIDASRMVGGLRTGTENYSDGIIRSLLAESVDWTWRLYFNGEAGESGLKPREDVQLRDIPARRFWTHARLSRELVTDRPDGLFVPAHVIPVIHPPSVVTIHDLGYLHVPEAHPPRQRLMLDLTTRWSASVARHIIVPSSRTRVDLVDRYGVRADKITVVHHGVHPRFAEARRLPDETFRQRYGLERDYVLAVGTIQPRKNLPLLARAMRAVDGDVELVIAGKRGWMAEDVIHDLAAAGLGNRLRFLDYIPDSDLAALYHHASVLVQPSRFEGFGMPVVEAMASGTPVITSRGSSLSEISGGAAMFYSQDDDSELAACIRTMVSDNDVNGDYKKRGEAWSGLFTWERAARKTRLVLQEALMDRE